MTKHAHRSTKPLPVLAAISMLSWQTAAFAAPVAPFDADAAAAFPKVLYSRIAEEIGKQLSFANVGIDKRIQWSPIGEIVTYFGRSPLMDDPSGYTFAIRYEVGVEGDAVHIRNGIAEAAIEKSAYKATCTAGVVYRNGTYGAPTVTCDAPDSYVPLANTLPLDAALPTDML